MTYILPFLRKARANLRSFLQKRNYLGEIVERNMGGRNARCLGQWQWVCHWGYLKGALRISSLVVDRLGLTCSDSARVINDALVVLV